MPSSPLQALLAVGALAAGAAGVGASAAAQGTPRDETSKGYAFIEVVPPQRAPFVGEPFIVRLRAGVDVDVLEANLVQPFRQPLDVPVQLDHPWFDGANSPSGGPTALDSARAVGVIADGVRNGSRAEADSPSPSGVARIALGAELASAARHVERGKEGRRFTVLELERTFFADAAGALVVPEARLGFAYALEFRDDLVAGRVALDRHDAFVRNGPQELTVRALPEAGRPFSFTGAVGQFTLSASIAPQRIESGATARLTVELISEGPHAAALESFGGPRLDRFAGFDVVASRESTEGSKRTFEIELAPSSAGRLSLEPIEFAVFDPLAERYVELATPRLTLEIASPRAAAPARDVERSTPPVDPDSARAAEEFGFSAAGSVLLMVGAAALFLVVAIVLIIAMRRSG